LVALVLALGSSLCWGTADFLGGVSSRRAPVAAVLLVSQVVPLAAALTWSLAMGDPPAAWRIGLGLIAGAGGVMALGAFYRALSIGTMSIVAPIAGTGAVVPVIAGLASGEAPGVLQGVGMVAAVVGVVLASRERHDDAQRAVDARRSVGLALVAAVGFGLFLALMEPASADGVPWALLSARGASVALLAGVVAARRIPLDAALTRAALPMVLAVGALDFTANALYAAATTKGLLAVVSVLGSLYPVATVLLARALLGERVRRIQGVGVAVVLAGVALIVAG
jgi:drug/metabolite transporter (DMT)-like permease